MIRLEDVSTNFLMSFAKSQARSYASYRSIYELLSKHNIKNYKELKELLESKIIEKENKDAILYLKGRIDVILSEIEIINATGKVPEIFTFDNYKNALIDDETANITDKNNNGNVLLCTPPYIRGGARLNTLNCHTVDEIKHLLSHLDCYNLKCNALAEKRNFGPKTASRVAKLIDFYDEQVIRQALETKKRGLNLFTLNKEEKDEIVRTQLREISEYILDTASECIWGTMTDTAKKRMLASSLSTRGTYIQKDKQTLIDAISDYTTLGELENDILVEQEVPTVIGGVITKTKTRPIDRFIIR